MKPRFRQGAFTTPATKQRIFDLIPQAAVVDLAEASETGSALSQVSAAGSQIRDRIFEPGPTVAVLHPGRSRRLAPGHEETGGLAKSGHIPLGYLNDPAKTAGTFPEIEGVRWSIPGAVQRSPAGKADYSWARDLAGTATE